MPSTGSASTHLFALLFAQDPEGKPKKATIRDNQDGTYTVSYVPDMTGRYTILIKYGGDEIPYSPYRIRALPTGDASKCTVTGESSSGQGVSGWGKMLEGGQATLNQRHAPHRLLFAGHLRPHCASLWGKGFMFPVCFFLIVHCFV